MCEKCKPLKGLHAVPKILAGGREAIYYFAWRGKGAPRILAPHGTADFVAEFWQKVTDRKTLPPGRFLLWMREYCDSREFKDNAERTRHDYIKVMPRIEAEFGEAPVRLFREPVVRGVIRRWHAKLVDQIGARQADMTLSVLSAILSLKVDDGDLIFNPCHGRHKSYRGNRRDKVWSLDDEKCFLDVAPPHLQEALILALWTGQRQGDLVRVRLAAYDGSHLNLVQHKSIGKRRDPVPVSIPVGGPLKALLDAKKERYSDATHILLNEHGQPWKIGKRDGPNGLRSSWRTYSIKAGLMQPRDNVDNLTFNDLRGTAATRLALAGNPDRTIAMITGHSLKEIASILDANYIKRDDEMVRGAIEKLELDTIRRLNAAAARKVPTVLPNNVVRLKPGKAKRARPLTPRQRARAEREARLAKLATQNLGRAK
jgi:integrase